MTKHSAIKLKVYSTLADKNIAATRLKLDR